MRRGRAARPAGAPAMRKLGHEGQSTYSTERESAFRSLCVETHSLCRNEYILRPAVAAVKLNLAPARGRRRSGGAGDEAHLGFWTSGRGSAGAVTSGTFFAEFPLSFIAYWR